MESLLELIQLINSGTTSLTTDSRNEDTHYQLIVLVEEAYSRNFILIPSYLSADSDGHFTSREISRKAVSGIENLKLTQRGQRFAETESITGNVVVI